MTNTSQARGWSRILRVESLERREMFSGAPPVIFTATGAADFTLALLPKNWFVD